MHHADSSKTAGHMLQKFQSFERIIINLVPNHRNFLTRSPQIQNCSEFVLPRSTKLAITTNKILAQKSYRLIWKAETLRI